MNNQIRKISWLYSLFGVILVLTIKFAFLSDWMIRTTLLSANKGESFLFSLFYTRSASTGYTYSPSWFNLIFSVVLGIILGKGLGAFFQRKYRRHKKSIDGFLGSLAFLCLLIVFFMTMNYELKKPEHVVVDHVIKHEISGTVQNVFLYRHSRDLNGNYIFLSNDTIYRLSEKSTNKKIKELEIGDSVYKSAYSDTMFFFNGPIFITKAILAE